MFLWLFVSLPVPPLYLMVRQKWGHFAVNLVLMVIAVFTLPIFGFGVFVWSIAAGHTCYLVWRDTTDQRATRIAQRLIDQDRLQREMQDKRG